MRIDDNSIRVDRGKCVACGICVDRCIMDNLRLSVAPCRQVCPVNMNCQGYIRLIASGNDFEALEHLMPFGPLVPLIAETCPAPCEKACTRRKHDGAVHIRELKRYLAGRYRKELDVVAVPAAGTGKNVAVTGTGIPALASGFKALQSGHAVTLFERPSESDAFPESRKRIAACLERAGACFEDSLTTGRGRLDPDLFDAVILSEPADLRFIKSLEENGPAEAAIDPVSRQMAGKIFCCESSAFERKSPVFEIANAFEALESVNRYVNGEPLGWGRGFYTQGGAVKEYQADQRIGSALKRLPEKDISGGLSSKMAREQASRCYSCGRAFEKNQTCWFCLPCELECPHGALEVRIPYLVR